MMEACAWPSCEVRKRKPRSAQRLTGWELASLGLSSYEDALVAVLDLMRKSSKAKLSARRATRAKVSGSNFGTCNVWPEPWTSDSVPKRRARMALNLCSEDQTVYEWQWTGRRTGSPPTKVVSKSCLLHCWHSWWASHGAVEVA